MEGASGEAVNAPPGKTTLKMLKGKSMNTSVPSIAIRFHANDEELEQLYFSESEEPSVTPEPKRESSPMKDVLSKLSKRSSSIDSNINESPTPDRWRLFTEIKGKLTKTVEEKISEIKSGSKVDSDSEDASENSSRFIDVDVSCNEDEVETSKDVDNDIFSTEDQLFDDEIIITMPKKSEANVQFKAKSVDLSIEDAEEAIEEDEIPVLPIVDKGECRGLKYHELLIGFLVWICSLILSMTSVPSYLIGLVLAGIVITVTKFNGNQAPEKKHKVFLQHKLNLLNRKQIKMENIFKVPTPKMYEDWMNEYAGKYDVHNYHISTTQTVYVKLEGSTLTLSTASGVRIPKRSMWNETVQNIDTVNFTHQRTFNMTEAIVKLLPEGLARKRYWSKKYPICLEFIRNSDNIDDDILPLDPPVDHSSTKSSPVKKPPTPTVPSPVNKPPTPTVPSEDTPPQEDNTDEETSVEWDTVEDAFDGVTRLYLFTRTDRSKEEWYRHFVAATHSENESSTPSIECDVQFEEKDEVPKSTQGTPSPKKVESNVVFEYENFVKRMQKNEDECEKLPVVWLNALFSRVMLDAVHQQAWVESLQQRIQRKLSVIRLPYFIEELTITELNLGTSVPTIHKISVPVFDEKGIWVDFDITYEGALHGTLETKLNLMKLKKTTEDLDKTIEQTHEPAYDSDLDDSAESSSEDDVTPANWFSTPQSVTPTQGATTGKKFLKMVDKIAASPFFQQATDYTFVKKALEGVSKTELKLRVELQGLVGVLTLNIPPPPSHRIWIGFRGNPQLLLNARPIVGERSLNFNHITSWIENKLQQEFQKLFVLPNMEDFVIPVMNLNLPE